MIATDKLPSQPMVDLGKRSVNWQKMAVYVFFRLRLLEHLAVMDIQLLGFRPDWDELPEQNTNTIGPDPEA